MNDSNGNTEILNSCVCGITRIGMKHNKTFFTHRDI